MPIRNLGALALLLMSQSPDLPAAESTETWWVNSTKKDCVGVGPMTCLEIQRNEKVDDTAWELFYDHVQGFDYEPGNRYRIEVRIRDREPPVPADASSKTYELAHIISKAPDPGLRLTNLWVVVSVGDIQTPVNARGEPLVFEFNAGMRSYAGDMGCNRVRGSIVRNDGTHLELGAGMATLMACPDMTVEGAVSEALSAARRYEIEDGLLRFFDEADNPLIAFRPGD